MKALRIEKNNQILVNNVVVFITGEKAKESESGPDSPLSLNFGILKVEELREHKIHSVVGHKGTPLINSTHPVHDCLGKFKCTPRIL